MSAACVLLVDPDQILLGAMAEYLQEAGYRVTRSRSYEEAVASLQRQPQDVIVAEVALPDADGFALIKYTQEHSRQTPVILVTSYGTIESAVEAIRFGAYDYLTKPILAEELKLSIDRALGQRRLAVENEKLKQQLDERYGLDNLVGRDYRMVQVYELIESVADTRAIVLITGESGTGKTMTARAIHLRSSRRYGPFVEVACGALPDTLLESELFGHKAGSFTGAMADKVGKFQLANGGTIFLDEIATASPSLQVKLLRVLQDMEFEPVGGTETIKVDARVILATNQNLAELVAEGKFRQDLYYRINVVSIHIPPLRERISDIPLLCKHFLEKYAKETTRKIAGFSPEAMELLMGYQWPGNIRELENVIERAVVLGKHELIQPADLPAALHHAVGPGDGHQQPSSPLKQAMRNPERQIILEALEAYNWNRQERSTRRGRSAGSGHLATLCSMSGREPAAGQLSGYLARPDLYSRQTRFATSSPVHGLSHGRIA